VAELAAHYQLTTAQIMRWKLYLREQAARILADVPMADAPVPDVESL
jgi:hypothetical protein